MRILYVTRESPAFPAGGIGTYIGYAAKAMQEAGAEVFLFTWTYDDEPPAGLAPFHADRVKILRLRGADVWQRYPQGPYDYGVSNLIRTQIAACVREWGIDVVEATDFQAPALAYFQDLQTRRDSQNVLCVSYNHGFIEDLYDADQIAPDLAAQDQLTSERQQLRISDVVIAPSRTAVQRLHGYDIVDNVRLIREPYVFSSRDRAATVRPNITYMGRI